MGPWWRGSRGGGEDFELSPEEEQEGAVGRSGGQSSRPRTASTKVLKWEEAWKHPSCPFPVPSCAEKLQSDEQVSRNLFGPPLESAFDHEDFTGDGGGASGTWAASRTKGGATARIGGSGSQDCGPGRREDVAVLCGSK